MRRFCFFVSIFLFSMALYAQNEPINNVKLSRWLDINSLPENGIDIYLNDSLIGKTPLHKKMKFGEYNILLKNDLYYDTLIKVILNNDINSILVEMKPKYGFARINSNPNGSLVFIDSVNTNLRTPCITEKILSGNHELTLLRNDYYPYTQTISINDGAVSEININYNESMIITDEDFDSLSKNNQLNYNELYTIEGESIKTRHINNSLTTDSDNDFRLDNRFTQNEQTNNDKLSGWLDIRSLPENGIDIYLNDSLIGKTPLHKKMRFGEYNILMKNDLYHDTLINVILNNDINSILVEMKPKYGFARINSNPKGSLVFIDSVNTNLRTPCITEKILSGNHELTLLRNDYYPYTQTISINDGVVSEINISYNESMIINHKDYDSLLKYNHLNYNDLYTIEGNSTKTRHTYNYATVKSNYGFRLGYKCGMNYSNIYGNDVSKSYKFVYKPLAGITGEYLFKNNWGIGFDVVYTEQAYSHDYQYYNSAIETDYSFQYFSMPLMFKYYISDKWKGLSFEIGPQISYCLEGELIYKIDDVENSKKFYDATNFFFDAVVGLSFDFTLGKYVLLNIGARYNLGLVTVYKYFNAKFDNLMGFVGMKWDFGRNK